VRKRSIGALAALAVALATLVAAGGSGAATRSTGGAAAKKKIAFKLRIGDVLPFTGGLAAYGPGLDQGSKIAATLITRALKQQGLAPRVSIKVYSEDGQTQASASVEAATKLIKVNKVQVIVGEMASSATIPVAQSVTIPNRIVQITPTSTAPQITDLRDNGYVFRILASDTFQGRALASAAQSAFGKNVSINVGARNDAFGVALKAIFERQWRSLGGKIGTSISYNPDQANYDTEAQQLVRGNPKGFVIIDFPETAAKLLPALVRTGRWSPAKTLMTEAMRDATVLKTIGAPATEGLRGTAPTSKGAPARAAFDRIFKRMARSGTPPETGFESSAFDATMLSFLAALKAHSASPARIKAQLRAVSGPPGKRVTFLQLRTAIKLLLAGKDINYEGAWGPIDFDRNGDPGSSIYELWRYSGGSIATLKTFTFYGNG
jgi:branched-chain amino acid transport system substrate-binding protein